MSTSLPHASTVPAPARGAGILLRLAATLLFTLMSVSVRLASVEAPVGQIVFWRSAVALLPIVLYLWWRGQLRHGLKTNRPMGHLKRSALGCASMFFSFLSLTHLPVALATALAFLAPLLVVPFAILWLGEKPGAIVIGATVAGFLGVGLMLWPALSGPALAVGALIGVVAGLANAGTTALAKIEIKRLTATETPAAIAFYFAVVCSVGGLLTLPFGWVAATPAALAALIAAGLFGGLAHIAMTEAIARAPASTLAPFEYTAMIWAVVFDILIFALWPTAFGLGGALLIVAAAAVVAFAEPLQAHFRRTRPA
jgi:drug/metabolite transporter (DMT)-like permease